MSFNLQANNKSIGRLKAKFNFSPVQKFYLFNLKKFQLNTLPLISVVVPNYNHSSFLGIRLDSIFKQSYPNFEVILLDDCSTDGSRDILLQFKDHPKVSQCVFNAENSGNTYKQWNRGIKLAKGEYIWIAESDDYCEHNFLTEVSKPLIKDRGITLAYCQSTRVNLHSEITGNWLAHTNNLDSKLFTKSFTMGGNEFIERFLILKNVIPNASGVLLRKERIDEIGSLDLDLILKYNGDWLFYLKTICNQKIAFLDQSLNHFRYHEESVIAQAGGKKSRLFLLKIENRTRKKMMYFLSKIAKPNNIRAIKKINKQQLNWLTYEKGKLLLKSNQKIKG